MGLSRTICLVNLLNYMLCNLPGNRSTNLPMNMPIRLGAYMLTNLTINQSTIRVTYPGISNICQIITAGGSVRQKLHFKFPFCS